MRIISQLALMGAGLCITGTALIFGAFVLGISPPRGSNEFGNLWQDYLFLAMLFGGLVVALMGVGFLIYIGVYRWHREQPGSNDPDRSAA